VLACLLHLVVKWWMQPLRRTSIRY